MSADPAMPSQTRSSLKTAWAEPDRFDWFSEYLRIHGLRVISRRLLAVTVGLISLIPTAILFSSHGAQALPQQIAAIATSLVGLAMAILWGVAPWPTSSQSTVFVVSADALITVGCSLDEDRLAGLMGTTIFAAIGGYIAFFHGARILTAHIVWSTTVVITLSASLAIQGDLALAVTKGLVAEVAVLVLPVCYLLTISLLGADSENSTTDSLTGLINRRGLKRAIPGLTRAGDRLPDHAVAVLVIDLDKFKRVNDSLGHDAGDRVLVETARRLQQTAAGHTLTCRTGGEEFVVVALLPVRSIPALAEAIRAAIFSPIEAMQISGSIGVAWSEGGRALESRSVPLAVDQLIRSADRAMYDAKRAGGNRVRFHPQSNDTPPSSALGDSEVPVVWQQVARRSNLA